MKAPRNPFAPTVRTQSPFSQSDDADRIAMRLREATDMLFPPSKRQHLSKDEKTEAANAATDFAQAATRLLALVGKDRSMASMALISADDARRIELLQAEAEMLRKEAIIDELLLACFAGQRQQLTTHQAIARLQKEIKKNQALIARNAKDARSKKIDTFVKHHAHRRWRENPKRRKTASGTASDIVVSVNEDLKAIGLEPIGEEAIRKRIRAFK